MSSTIARPTETELFEIIARLHTETPQQKYQYSNRVLKYARIGGEELARAFRADPDTTEEEVWRGKTAREVADRLAGNLTQIAESADRSYRSKWAALGLPEGSWATFVSVYCNTRVLSIPMSDERNHRVSEADNFLLLLEIFDDEVMNKLDDAPKLREALKSKWWKECHKVFSASLRTVARDAMTLGNTPDHLCHIPKWDDAVKMRVRVAARRWRENPIWYVTDRDDVDFTANNERTVADYLGKYEFNESALSK